MSKRNDYEASALDTKAIDSRAWPDGVASQEGVMRLFEAFKAGNDERLDEIERRGSADCVTTERLERIEKALADAQARNDAMALKANRTPLGGSAAGEVQSRAGLEHKAAFDSYVRRGDQATLRQLEAKALSIGSDPDGGFLVPPATEHMINVALRNISPIRAISGVRNVSAAIYKQPFNTSGTDTGWVGEAVVRPQTNTPALSDLVFPTMELYAMPAATSSLLDDAVVNIDSWLAEEVRIAFALQEGSAFVKGDGVSKPKGFMSYPTVAQASWSFGNLGYVATGTAGAFSGPAPSDKLIDLTYALRAPYRANATFVMNRATLSAIRKIKDLEGDYLWEPSGSPGQPATLMGYAVAEAEEMPDIAAGSFAIAFGDFKRGYLIVDRVGIRVLRDPYSAKPYVLFYTTKRVGGGVLDFDAIKLMKFDVS